MSSSKLVNLCEIGLIEKIPVKIPATRKELGWILPFQKDCTNCAFLRFWQTGGFGGVNWSEYHNKMIPGSLR